MTARGRLLFMMVALAALALLGATRSERALAANAVPSIGAPSLDVAATTCVREGVASGVNASLQETAHHAGLLIVFPDRVESYCIEFAGDEISGTEMLRQTGLSIVLAGFGGLGSGVCRIEEVGCSDPGDCYCQCRGADCHYWAYFGLRNGAWQYSALGPSQRRLHDGDVDAWVWGSNRSSVGAARGPCPTAEPTPVPTPVVAPAESTPGPPSTGSMDRGANPPNSQEPGATASFVVTGTSVPTRTPAPQAARQDGGKPAASTSESASGGGVPAGLIAFGAVAGVLAAGIGGLVLRRRIVG